MKGFVKHIEDLAIQNAEFRRVLYTVKHCQLVVMALKPKEELGTGSSPTPAATRTPTASISMAKRLNNEPIVRLVCEMNQIH